MNPADQGRSQSWRVRRVALVALIAVASAGLWNVASPGRGPEAEHRTVVVDPTALLRDAQGNVPPPPLLARPGSVVPRGMRSRGVGGSESESTPPASPDPASMGAGTLVAGAPLAPPGAVLGPAFALAPGAVSDGIVGTASAPLSRPRSDLVGRIGPYGIRDAWNSGRFGWLGVARIRRDENTPSEASDDTKDPVTTAVRGVVVGQDGSPIRDAEVILYSTFYLRQAFYDHRVRQLGRVLTDGAGVFDLRPVDLDTVHFGADGEVLVTVRHPSHPDLVVQVLGGIVPGSESDVGRLVLPDRGATIHGVVSDLSGRPVSGAVVRVSGAMNPTDYDKTERLVVLDACPAATTDADGRYTLVDFAPGVHEVSVHLRLDCVLHGSDRWEGDREWSPRVQAGNEVRGRVVDPEGAPVAAAVVFGGGNWTPTNPDGTFWLDNVQAGPITLEVAHAAWRTVVVPGVATNAEDVVVTERERLARATWTVVDTEQKPVPLVAVDWAWPSGGGPGRFAPDSRYWHDPHGVMSVVVPEGAVGATVSDAAGAAHALAPVDLLDGAHARVVLTKP